MGEHQRGPANPNWKGGRSVASNGYVLVRVGVGHHLADVRGYAYEHRVVAEEKVGRRLLPGEHVHHKDENTANNHPDNLVVMASAAEHRLAHRSAERQLRMPGEPNPEVACACGCGTTFARFDESGRPRAWVSGHNPTARPTRDALRAALTAGPRSPAQIALLVGRSRRAVATALAKMVVAGEVARVGRGRYGALGTPVDPVASPPRLVACTCGCGAELIDRDRYGRSRRFVSGHNGKRAGLSASDAALIEKRDP